jgi:hypothetical protein
MTCRTCVDAVCAAIRDAGPFECQDDEEREELGRMKLIAISTVSYANTPDSAKSCRQKISHEFMSEALVDVCKAIDREIALTKTVRLLEGDIVAARQQIVQLRDDLIFAYEGIV